jgi:threonine dehydratase
MISLPDIVAAQQRFGDLIKVTPCQVSDALSASSGATVWLKLENLQHTGSFKARGALNRLMAMSDDDKKRGVIAASAGNHAQGLAYHATRLGVRATIVMPVGTPLIKVTRTGAYGADVVLKGENYDEAFEEATRIAAEKGFVLVHGYDDDAVMAGQGTIGLELDEQCGDLDVVIIPVGGGGLISGIATALKASNPKVRIIGVEAVELPSMAQAIAAGAPVQLPPARTIADGIAVRQVGRRCVEVCAALVDELVVVDDDEISRAILYLLEREKTVTEGAGATGVAALLSGRVKDVAGKRVCVVLSGGNIDVNVISRIIERGLVESGRLARLSVVIPDRPGALAEMLREVAAVKANVVEVHHERAFARGSLAQVTVDLVVETRGHSHANELIDRLVSGGYTLRSAPADQTKGNAV